MAKGLEFHELRRLAQLGAQARLAQLDQERAHLLREFPALGRGQATAEVATGDAPKRRRRSRMSAAARKAVSARMKAYWAQRRATNRKSA